MAGSLTTNLVLLLLLLLLLLRLLSFSVLAFFTHRSNFLLIAKSKLNGGGMERKIIHYSVAITHNTFDAAEKQEFHDKKE